ncbi:sigma-70 family RNA polymerase sigma factor [Chitinophaga sp. OAE865]|uniref:RNA polymerase sigma factor n=1 Tax=Chitinophaga sp. OAE865 TaxID=2817898 RepID=UPI001AE52847
MEHEYGKQLPVNQTYNERTLLLQIAAGDELAYRQVFNSHWNQIYQVALSFLKTPGEAKEAVQTVFIKLWEKRHKLPEVNNFDAWLFIVARNTIVNILHQQTSFVDVAQVGDTVPEDYLTPDSLLEYKQTASLIQDAIALLPPQQSVIFRLSREQGLTHPQIARELNIAPATVKSHMVRALNTIREYVRKQGGNALLIIWLLEKIGK